MRSKPDKKIDNRNSYPVLGMTVSVTHPMPNLGEGVQLWATNVVIIVFCILNLLYNLAI
jgi:hypothetical protein